MHATRRNSTRLGALGVLLALGASSGCGFERLDLRSELVPSPAGSSGGASQDGQTGGSLATGGGGGAFGGGTGGALGMTGGRGGLPGTGGEASGGQMGFGGEPPACKEPSCPLCCEDVDMRCEPFRHDCVYCEVSATCPNDWACDPLTNRCLAGCGTPKDLCPSYAPHCDAERRVCLMCTEAAHCGPGSSCIQGFCVPCSTTCE